MSAVQTAKYGVWQPMDTAPQSVSPVTYAGPDVFVWAHGRCWIAHYMRGGWVTDGVWIDPDAWMPLPLAFPQMASK